MEVVSNHVRADKESSTVGFVQKGVCECYVDAWMNARTCDLIAYLQISDYLVVASVLPQCYILGFNPVLIAESG